VGDAGAKAVQLFYEALLQVGPPTLEQEKAIFNDEPWISDIIRAQTGLSSKDPSILIFFRAHKEVFLPASIPGKSVNALRKFIQISNTFSFPRNLEQTKGDDVPKFAMSTYPKDPSGSRPTTEREIVFALDRDKLDPELIFLGGFEGDTTYQTFFAPKAQK
jgi:hypothetical protein